MLPGMVVIIAAVASCGFGVLLVRSRHEISALRLRFPQNLLDLDAEVIRLEKLKADIQLELTQAKDRAERNRKDGENDTKPRRQEWERKYVEAMAELQRLHGEVEGLSDEAE